MTRLPDVLNTPYLATSKEHGSTFFCMAVVKNIRSGNKQIIFAKLTQDREDENIDVQLYSIDEEDFYKEYSVQGPATFDCESADTIGVEPMVQRTGYAHVVEEGQGTLDFPPTN